MCLTVVCVLRYKEMREKKFKLKTKSKKSLHNIFKLKDTIAFEFDELLLMEHCSTSEARRSSLEWRRWPKIADWPTTMFAAVLFCCFYTALIL